MLKICGDTICKPLKMIFSQALSSGSFPSEWKKGNMVPIHKKYDKQNLINYRPVSLLPICGKIFERLIFNEMFRFFLENKLIKPHQSGFKPGGYLLNILIDFLSNRKQKSVLNSQLSAWASVNAGVQQGS